MKFVNKLSVISLIVLMFSFMNIAQAACVGNSVSYCDVSKNESACNNTWRKEGTQLQCKWDGKICRANGASCSANQSVDLKTYKCRGTTVVKTCDGSKTQAACENTYRAAGAAATDFVGTMNCVWENNKCAATQRCSTSKVTNCNQVEDCYKDGWGNGAVCAIGTCGYGG